MASIVLISSGQPSANPRLVKEAVALSGEGYEVKVIYCALSPWADAFDRELFAQHSAITWIKAGYHPVKEKRWYQLARFRRKLFHLLFRVAGNVADAAVRSFAFYSQELSRMALQHKADLYIGHNIGALPSVVHAALAHGSKAVFDFEDFHRGEDQIGSQHWKKVKAIEDKYVPLLAGATAAAPLITAEYRKLYPALTIETINNCFPLQYGTPQLQAIAPVPLKLFWFSQFIGPKRGLETVIAAMGKTGNGSIELSLLGNGNTERTQYFLAEAAKHGLGEHQIRFIDAVPEKEIAGIAAAHHIGLAVEVPHIYNREICLTNKLFMYLLAGNAILFSNTKAQAAFLDTYPDIGELYAQGDVDELTAILNRYAKEPSLLLQQRERSFETGRTLLNWEQEAKVYLQYIETFLNR